MSGTVLDSLSEKQREVLDLLLDRRTNKEIARELDISVSGVEQRLQSARNKLGASSRAEAAREYERLLIACGLTTSGKNQVQSKAEDDDQLIREAADESLFRIEDSLPFDGKPTWQEPRPHKPLLEMLDERFGIGGRIAVIIGLAALTALVLLSVLSIADALDRLF